MDDRNIFLSPIFLSFKTDHEDRQENDRGDDMEQGFPSHGLPDAG